MFEIGFRVYHGDSCILWKILCGNEAFVEACLNRRDTRADGWLIDLLNAYFVQAGVIPMVDWYRASQIAVELRQTFPSSPYQLLDRVDWLVFTLV